MRAVVALALVLSAVACSDTKVETVPGVEAGTKQVQVNGEAVADIKVKTDEHGTDIAATPPTATAGQPAAAEGAPAAVPAAVPAPVPAH
jgi:hypothetical protein